MRSYITTIVLLLVGFAGQAQGINTGVLRVQGTVGLGVSKQELRYYVLGEFEGLVADHVGLQGAVMATLGSDRSIFDSFVSPPFADDHYIHSVIAGPVYHFLADSPLDVHVGVQPGVSLSQIHYVDGRLNLRTSYGVLPTATALAGVAYYGSFFHLFGQVRYVAARHNEVNVEVPLSDLRIAVGLGFNIDVKD